MAETLTIADNEDGTGAVGTIAGSGGGTQTVRVFRPADGLGALAAVGSFTRAGDGDVDLELDPGGYLATLDDGGDATALLVRFNATDASASSEWDAILDALAAYLQGLSIAGFTPDQIKKTKVPWAGSAGTTPGEGLLVCPAPETLEAKFNVSDNIGYACLVTAYRASNKSQTTPPIGETLKARDQMLQALKITPSRSPQSIIPVAGVYNLTLEPGSVINPEIFLQQNLDASAFIVRVWVRRNRSN